MARDPRRPVQSSTINFDAPRESSRIKPISPVDNRTALDVYKEQQERYYKQQFKTEDFNKAVTSSIKQMKKKYPDEAANLLELQKTGKGELSPTAQRFLQPQVFQMTKEQKINNALDRQSQFAGLLTAASSLNSAVNVASRLSLAQGAYNAQVAGRVIEFEDRQRAWENTKRGVYLLGSIGSTMKVTGLLGGAASAPLTIAAVGATFFGQVARIVNDNLALSGERKRQDSDAQYHQMTYGKIITRGNR